jgi:uncharacterized protein YqhQ
MDFKKIFIKGACPTKIGGQAVLEGIMMKGEDRTAVVVRRPDDSMYIHTEKLKPRGKSYSIPVLRGIMIFVDSLTTGIRTLMLSAELLESADYPEDDNVDMAADGVNTGGVNTGGVEAADEKAEDGGRFTHWLINRFGEKAPLTFALVSAVIISLTFTIGIFIIAPTWVMDLLGIWIKNEIALNLIEGVFRILLFVIYILLVSRMKDIRTVFKFHGAEHQCIHCFEGGKELTPENCEEYDTLHPRCGTSFLMFVMVIALLLFSLLGWPNLLVRIASRLLLVPVIAGLSYELLRWAGNADNLFVKILSVPGLLLQKITTLRPDRKQLAVAIAALKAVLTPANTPVIDGICDENGELIPEKPEFEGYSLETLLA